MLLIIESMCDKYIYLFIENFVNERMPTESNNISRELDYSSIIDEFIYEVNKTFVDDLSFCKLLISMFIPESYEKNKSREKLYTKLTEVMFFLWCKRMGFEVDIITKKSGIEDVRFSIGNKTIVVDVKTFRLGRSQKAPNVKDFLKLSSVKLWIKNCNKEYKNENHKKIAIGGLVVYTSLHEWDSNSEVYIECSNKEIPTLMLSYEYLAFMLLNKNKYNVEDLIKLWDYNRLFFTELDKEDNKNKYWEAINNELCNIMNIKNNILIRDIKETYFDFIQNCCWFQYNRIEEHIMESKKKIESEILDIKDIDTIKKEFVDFKYQKENENLIESKNRILKFRIKKNTK